MGIIWLHPRKIEQHFQMTQQFHSQKFDLEVLLLHTQSQKNHSQEVTVETTREPVIKMYYSSPFMRAWHDHPSWTAMGDLEELLPHSLRDGRSKMVQQAMKSVWQTLLTVPLDGEEHQQALPQNSNHHGLSPTSLLRNSKFLRGQQWVELALFQPSCPQVTHVSLNKPNMIIYLLNWADALFLWSVETFWGKVNNSFMCLQEYHITPNEILFIHKE